MLLVPGTSSLRHYHDASIPYGGDMRAALARIEGNVLMLVSMTDRTIPGYLSRELYAGLHDAA